MALDFGLIDTGLFPASSAVGDGLTNTANTIIWNDVGIGIVPIGGVVAWCKTLVGAPPLLPNWQECDGAAIANGESPFNGLNTPDLNTTQRMLRGNTASGATGGADSHTHSVNNYQSGANEFDHGSKQGFKSGTAARISSLSAYYEMVWIMRIY